MKSVLERWREAEAFGEDFNGSPCMILPNKPKADGWLHIKLNGKNVYAHKAIYEALIGPVPEGHELDHRCAATNGLRSCVNPWHLEPVTHAENVLRGNSPSAANARKASCAAGHEYTAENTRIESRGGRSCKQCERERSSARYASNIDESRAAHREYMRAYRAQKRRKD